MARLQLKLKLPIGSLYLVASANGLQGVYFERQDVPMVSGAVTSEARALSRAAIEIEEYFRGQRKKFEMPLDLQGTEFQKRVWAEVLKIPYGETRSYGEIAAKINNRAASRAVGSANGKNPICIIVPCHRVIAAGGKLGGYSGGLEKKIKLLEFEKK